MLLNRTLDLYISCWKVCVDQTALFELGEPCALNHLTLFVKYAPMVPLFRSSPKRITKWSKCMICGFGYFWLNSTPWNTPQTFLELHPLNWGSGIPPWADAQRETTKYADPLRQSKVWRWHPLVNSEHKNCANHSESCCIPRQEPASFPWKWPIYSDIRIETQT